MILQNLARKTRKVVDRTSGLALANLGLVYGSLELAERAEADSTKWLIGAGTTATLYGLNKTLVSPRVRRLFSKVNDRINSNKIAYSLKITSLLGGAIFFGNEIMSNVLEIKNDLFVPSGIERRAEDMGIEPLEVLVEETAPLSEGPARLPKSKACGSRSIPSACEHLGYESGVEHDFTGTTLADKEGLIGRIQRTLRWQPIYEAVEEAYGMPRGLLAGMIMEESYGNPVQPNSSGDGGLGLVHIQGVVAEENGLNIYGSSGSSHDTRHGRQIIEMLRECGYDPACAQEHDDRGHLIKVLDAAARIVTRGKNRNGYNTLSPKDRNQIDDELEPWVWGTEYYRAPGKVGRGTTWRYFVDVQKWRRGILGDESIAAAAADFDRRNPETSFEEYIGRWHEMSNNWGLANYKESFGVN